MYGCESWTLKKAERQRIDAFELWCWEDSWESLGLQGDKGDQPWDFFGKNDAKAETPVLWPPHAKSWLIGKDSDAGRDLGEKEKGMTEDEMAGWHHWLNACGSEWTPGVGDGQGGLVCCDSWGHKELDMTEQLNWTECHILLQLVPSSLVTCILIGIHIHKEDFALVIQWPHRTTLPAYFFQTASLRGDLKFYIGVDCSHFQLMTIIPVMQLI